MTGADRALRAAYTRSSARAQRANFRRLSRRLPSSESGKDMGLHDLRGMVSGLLIRRRPGDPPEPRERGQGQVERGGLRSRSPPPPYFLLLF